MKQATDTGSPPDQAFGENYYRRECGPEPYARNKQWQELFSAIAEHIVARFSPRTVLDAGCAIGLLVEELRLRGVEAWGIDISQYAIGQANDVVRDFVRESSLTRPLPDELPQTFELATCIEVLEHISASHVELALDTLCNSADTILFSSSPHDLTEATHLNVRSPEDWVAAFAARGFRRSRVPDVSFITEWTILFERASIRPQEFVRQYERDLIRAEREVAVVRSELLRLSQLVGSLRPDQLTADSANVVSHLESDRLDQEREEFRSQLASLEAELQEAREETSRLLAINTVLETELESTPSTLGYAVAGETQARALLEMIYASETWRAGRVVTAPVRWATSLRRRPK